MVWSVKEVLLPLFRVKYLSSPYAEGTRTNKHYCFGVFGGKDRGPR